MVVALMVWALNCSATGAKSKNPIWIWSAVVAPKNCNPQIASRASGHRGEVDRQRKHPGRVVGHALVIGTVNTYRKLPQFE